LERSLYYFRHLFLVNKNNHVLIFGGQEKRTKNNKAYFWRLKKPPQ
jgi:hypothetical protein